MHLGWRSLWMALVLRALKTRTQGMHVVSSMHQKITYMNACTYLMSHQAMHVKIATSVIATSRIWLTGLRCLAPGAPRACQSLTALVAPAHAGTPREGPRLYSPFNSPTLLHPFVRLQPSTTPHMYISPCISRSALVSRLPTSGAIERATRAKQAEDRPQAINTRAHRRRRTTGFVALQLMAQGQGEWAHLSAYKCIHICTCYSYVSNMYTL